MGPFVLNIFLEGDEQPTMTFESLAPLPLPNIGETIFVSDTGGGELTLTVRSRFFTYAPAFEGSTVAVVAVIGRIQA